MGNYFFSFFWLKYVFGSLASSEFEFSSRLTGINTLLDENSNRYCDSGFDVDDFEIWGGQVDRRAEKLMFN